MWYLITAVASFIAGFVVCFIWRSKIIRELHQAKEKLVVELEKIKE